MRLQINLKNCPNGQEIGTFNAHRKGTPKF